VAVYILRAVYLSGGSHVVRGNSFGMDLGTNLWNRGVEIKDASADVEFNKILGLTAIYSSSSKLVRLVGNSIGRRENASTKERSFLTPFL